MADIHLMGSKRGMRYLWPGRTEEEVWLARRYGCPVLDPFEDVPARCEWRSGALYIEGGEFLLEPHAYRWESADVPPSEAEAPPPVPARDVHERRRAMQLSPAIRSQRHEDSKVAAQLADAQRRMWRRQWDAQRQAKEDEALGRWERQQAFVGPPKPKFWPFTWDEVQAVLKRYESAQRLLEASVRASLQGRP